MNLALAIHINKQESICDCAPENESCQYQPVFKTLSSSGLEQRGTTCITQHMEVGEGLV